MLQKLTTHDIQDVTDLFSFTNKCSRTAEGYAWHTSPAPRVGSDSKPDARTTAQGSGNNNKKKKKKKKKVGGNNQPLTGAPTATAAAVGGCRDPRGNKWPHQVSGSDDGCARCPVHNSTRHSMSEC
jgi:hypothetical protein